MSSRSIESQKDTTQIGSCDGKVAFLTRGTAKAASARRPGRIIYKCVHCRSWHVGTPTPRLKLSQKREKRVRLVIETDDDRIS